MKQGIHSENYYDKQSLKYPVITDSIIESMIIYFAKELYAKEFNVDSQIAYNRITISDTDSGENISLTDIVQNFKRNINLLPFTVYNIIDYKKSDDVSNISPFGELGLRFNEDLNSKLIIYPVTLELQFVSFFNTALDFFGAFNRINSSKMFNEMLYTFVLLNGKEKQIPFRIKFETVKGGLVSKFQDYLTQNKIYNFITTCTILYYEYQLKSLKDYSDTNYAGNINSTNNSSDPNNIIDNENLEQDLNLGKVDNLLLRLGNIRYDGKGIYNIDDISIKPLIVNSFTIDSSVPNLDVITIIFNEPICDVNNKELIKKINIKNGFITPLNSYKLVDDETKLIIEIYNRDISMKTKIVLSKTITNYSGFQLENDYEIEIP